MQFVQKYRFLLAALIVIVVGGGLIYITYQYLKPLPQVTTFNSGDLSFTYPRIYDAQEYSAGVVSIGHKNGEALIPLVEVDEYKSDPDQTLPKDFNTFIKFQASALCGADGPIESISCTQVGITPYTSTGGLTGQQLSLVLVRKNLKTATTSSSTYGPFYVFNTTASSTADSPLRYSAVFVYPSLSAFIDNATTSPALLNQVVGSLKLSVPISKIGQ